MKILGIAASDGITIGKVFKLETVELKIPDNVINKPEEEIVRFQKALEETTKELKDIRDKTAIKIDEEHAMIFDSHIQIANDPEIFEQVKNIINDTSINAAHAFMSVSEEFAKMFELMDSSYMRERAADVRDVSRRVTSHLLGITLNDPTLIDEEVVIIANDLTPSDTAQLNRDFVKGFITNIGGRTSHSAIMARSLEIPAVVGAKGILESTKNKDIVILNGLEGYVIINPSNEEINEHRQLNSKYLEEVALSEQFANKKTITKDDIHVELAANIGSPDDIAAVLSNGAEGVGLYRTEFLYMNNSDFPSEDQQYEAYKIVLEALPNKKVIIRTLDIGGDKKLDYLPMDEELNPFLGHRALRLCLENIDLFKTQLRALLRSSIHGNLHIMFPMVATLDELRQAKAILKECENELKAKKIKVSDNYKVGIMVEIPSVAILADRFAKEVDFFSIGTNDLIQYSFAADRMNNKVSYLYQPCNPSLLRLIKLVIEASHKEGIWTGMCGEMAGDSIAAPILLGLGLDEFSMTATSIIKTRKLFSELKQSDMKEMALKAINLDTNDQVIELVKSYLK